MVVSGTIAPSRELPDLSAEETIRIILSNLNLVVPVVAALLVIIIAIVVICVLRSKGNHHKGTTAQSLIVFSLLLFSVRCVFSMWCPSTRQPITTPKPPTNDADLIWPQIDALWTFGMLLFVVLYLFLYIMYDAFLGLRSNACV